MRIDRLVNSLNAVRDAVETVNLGVRAMEDHGIARHNDLVDDLALMARGLARFDETQSQRHEDLMALFAALQGP